MIISNMRAYTYVYVVCVPFFSLFCVVTAHFYFYFFLLGHQFITMSDLIDFTTFFRQFFSFASFVRVFVALDWLWKETGQVAPTVAIVL